MTKRSGKQPIKLKSQPLLSLFLHEPIVGASLGQEFRLGWRVPNFTQTKNSWVQSALVQTLPVLEHGEFVLLRKQKEKNFSAYLQSRIPMRNEDAKPAVERICATVYTQGKAGVWFGLMQTCS